ncbi:hypothetical protein CEP52_004612 [Fusarium oligoseptatum]|uniref:Uncharacterized protein n=1 Tax=Fusarium oligoseptatum TaxID=2604345 RepID=A0A428U312_9HYPO|nr:hypothetical protein CEP52_004612 [Fusarium oligoseptatum]
MDGRYSEAVVCLEKSHVWAVGNLPETDMERFKTQRYLARAHLNLGQPENAIGLLEDLLASLEHVDERDNGGLLATKYYLARAYKESYQVIDRMRRHYNTNTVDFLRTTAHLAVAYREQGNLDKAIELFEHIFAVRQERLGQDHDDTIWTENSLAVTYCRNKQYEKAVPLYEHILAVRRSRLDEEAVSGLTWDLATAYFYLNQAQKAAPLFKRLLEIKRARYGDDHSDIATLEGWLQACDLAMEKEEVHRKD